LWGDRLLEWRIEVQSRMRMYLLRVRKTGIVGAETRGQFGNSEERKPLPFETVTRRLLKTPLTEKNNVCSVMNFRQCKSVK
jgi:hypothetical protein